MSRLIARLMMFCSLAFRSSALTTSVRPYGCDCMKVPGTSQCLKYDNRLQAQSLDEAMSSFEDLSLLEDPKPSEVEQHENTLKCQNEKCRTCRKLLKQKLNSVGLAVGFVDAMAGGNLGHTCNKYRFARPNSDTVSYQQVIRDADSESASSEEVDKKADKWKQEVNKEQAKESTSVFKSFFNGLLGRKNPVEDPGAEESEELGSDEDEQPIRRKRQSAAVESANFIGTRYFLSCTEKGTEVTGLLSLCSKCWVWRELPENYWPRYLNELVCHDNDTTCLSGFATCQSGTQQLDVLKNESGTMVAVSLAASTYCECQVKVGSTLEPLVVGNAAATSLPPVDSESNLPLV